MSSILSKDWFAAVIDRSHVTIPKHISAVLEILPPVVKAAMDDFHSKKQFEYKEDDSPAGDADWAIENILKQHLMSRFPDYYFKGEETDVIKPHEYQDGDVRWLVDPIDGTRNNEYGRDDFAVSIALQSLQDGQWQTKDALLLLPVKGEIIWASENQGAYLLNYNPMVTSDPVITVVKVSADDPRLLNKTLVDLSTKPFPPKEEGTLITLLREEGITHRNVGSAAIAIANVGSKADGAVVLAHDYDVAAGILIAKEAGAKVTEDVYETARGPLSLVIAGSHVETHQSLAQKCAFVM